MIEPVAGRLFDIYYQYTSSSCLVPLQSLTEEAFKLYERLKKLPAQKKRLLELNEFLLLKALRNYSVHTGEFYGTAYAVKKEFAVKHKLDLLRVCLIDKKIVSAAINAEKPLDYGEKEKISRIQSQLVNFGDYYNIEPVIFNFIVKIYEILISLNLTIPGDGFSNFDKSYKNEVYYNYPHYVPLDNISASSEAILENIIPLEEAEIHLNKGLTPEPDDPFNIASVLNVDCSRLKVFDFKGGDYQAMQDSMVSKLTGDYFAINLPKHLGLALLDEGRDKKPEKTAFNIRKQKDVFAAFGINLNSGCYKTTASELLVLLIIDGTIFPTVISKESLLKST